MDQDFLSLCHLLKTKREEKNLSLKEVENATSIRIHFLSAIEEGDMTKLIAPIYAQGFIKRYASYLQIENEPTVVRQIAALKELAEEPIKSQEFSYGIGSVEVRNTSASSEIKWLGNALWISLSVLVLLSGYFLGRFLGIF